MKKYRRSLDKTPVANKKVGKSQVGFPTFCLNTVFRQLLRRLDDKLAYHR